MLHITFCLLQAYEGQIYNTEEFIDVVTAKLKARHLHVSNFFAWVTI